MGILKGHGMEADRIKWNRRYRAHDYPETASDVVRRFWSLAPSGRALDIAAGNGRNALYLAERGFEVDAVDISDVATDRLRQRHPKLRAVCADLDTYAIGARIYSVILNIRFLSRRLFPQLMEGLVPGGLLLVETFIHTTAEDGGPVNPDYLLRENELLHAFLPLHILFYEESESEGPRGRQITATLAARKKA